VEILKKSNYKIPVYSWCPDLEPEARTQVDNLAQLPFAFDHIALMPDAHMGYGMPIGGVIALEDVVIPNAVGVN
jgi:tRNA-splicing ligase RtcB (3'-phosphate/5'-hydroxy nucleic acid ligase)